MSLRSGSAVIMAVWLAAACAKPADNTVATTATTDTAAAQDPAAVQQSIEAANQRFIDGMQRGDTSVVTQNYQDDAVVMMPGEATWTGADAMHKGFAGFLARATISDAKVTTQNVMLGGDLAVETGTYEWTVHPKNGKPMHDKGKYLTVWKRQADGSWKIVRDINNSDMPAA